MSLTEIKEGIQCDRSITPLINQWTWTFSPPHAARPPRAQASLTFISRTLYAHRLALLFYRYVETEEFSALQEVNKWASVRRSDVIDPIKVSLAQEQLWDVLRTVTGRVSTMSGSLLDVRSDNFWTHMVYPKPLPDIKEIFTNAPS